MTILLHAPSDADEWLGAFQSLLPEETIETWPNVADPAAVDLLIAWRHDANDVAGYPNLKAILVLGAGVEQFASLDYPDVPIVRLADDTMSDEMATYALHWVLHFQRRYDAFLDQQRAARWEELPYTPAPEYTVGILGYGNIGRRVGDAFAAFGYQVAAWSRSSGNGDEAISRYAGLDELDSFLGSCDAVVNVLPHTAETERILNADRFAACRPGMILVNIGRGATTDEADLVSALDSGQLGAAAIDVTTIEPLPSDSPLWSHPRVRITPHAAGYTQIPSAAALIAANVGRIRVGDQPFPAYQRSRGY